MLRCFSATGLIKLATAPVPRAVTFFGGGHVIGCALRGDVISNMGISYHMCHVGARTARGNKTVLRKRGMGRRAHCAKRVGAVDGGRAGACAGGRLGQDVVGPTRVGLVLSACHSTICARVFGSPRHRPGVSCLPGALVFTLGRTRTAGVIRVTGRIFKHASSHFIRGVACSTKSDGRLVQRFQGSGSFHVTIAYALITANASMGPLRIIVFVHSMRSRSLCIRVGNHNIHAVKSRRLHGIAPGTFDGSYFCLISTINIARRRGAIPATASRPAAGAVALGRLLRQVDRNCVPSRCLGQLTTALTQVCGETSGSRQGRFRGLTRNSVGRLSTEVCATLRGSALPPFVGTGRPGDRHGKLISPLTGRTSTEECLLVLTTKFIGALVPNRSALVSGNFSMRRTGDAARTFRRFYGRRDSRVRTLHVVCGGRKRPVACSVLGSLRGGLGVTGGRFASGRL